MRHLLLEADVVRIFTVLFLQILSSSNLLLLPVEAFFVASTYHAVSSSSLKSNKQQRRGATNFHRHQQQQRRTTCTTSSSSSSLLFLSSYYKKEDYDNSDDHDNYYAPSRPTISSTAADDDEPDLFRRRRNDSSVSSIKTKKGPQPPPSRADNINYWDEDEDDDPSEEYYTSSSSSTDYYDNDNNSKEPETLEWEECRCGEAGTAWVLLPNSNRPPSAIIHFCGGTVAGSAPQLWYGQLLQELVQHTSAAVVATSIPISYQKPLNHVRLARQLQDQFQTAWRVVLMDEYGPDVLDNSGTIPVCGLGHSLGARLLLVLATLESQQQSTFYKSMMLISFTNFGASAGIPGLAQLVRQSRRVQQEQEQQGRDNYAEYDNDMLESDEPKSRKSGGRRRRPRRRDDNEDNWMEDDDDDDDVDLRDLWRELTATVQAGSQRVQRVLTPNPSSLEFHPSPEQLWNALAMGRYRVPQTLVVQLDDDEIDQSAPLATALLEVVPPGDVKFARLRGTHWTPVAVSSDKNHNSSSKNNGKWWQPVNLSQASRLLLRGLQGRQRSKQQQASLCELRQSLARYITEVVTKE